MPIQRRMTCLLKHYASLWEDDGANQQAIKMETRACMESDSVAEAPTTCQATIHSVAMHHNTDYS